MKPNNEQIKIIEKVRGGAKLPSSPETLASWLTEFLLTRDYDAEDFELMQKCRNQFIRSTQQKSNDQGFVYISVIKNDLTRRVYFNELSKRLAMREIDPIRHVMQSLIKDGLVKRNGLEVMNTSKANEYLTNQETGATK